MSDVPPPKLPCVLSPPATVFGYIPEDVLREGVLGYLLPRLPEGGRVPGAAGGEQRGGRLLAAFGDVVAISAVVKADTDTRGIVLAYAHECPRDWLLDGWVCFRGGCHLRCMHDLELTECAWGGGPCLSQCEPCRVQFAWLKCPYGLDED